MLVKIKFLPCTARAALKIEVSDMIRESIRLRWALVLAVERGTHLMGANLMGANLMGANLMGANLRDADLRDANLRGANLRDANLRGANLRGANLRGAIIKEDIKLEGKNPIIKIGPIGSEGGTLSAYRTGKGTYMERGCFFGTLDEFAAQVEDTHGSNKHGDIYRATIEMIEVWADAQDGEST
ncbi:MAG: pentapeptide repeat-containing protein [Magnetovibrio sp.]|nr:pentapeptide repeat-containing protein [Magnetovibrio sp.]